MPTRLGDDIDDFCVKCKRVMNHAIVSLVNEEPAKVRCKTCHGDHDFRHQQAPPPKVDARKAARAAAKAAAVGEAAPAEPSPADETDDGEAAPVKAGAE